MMLRGKPMTVLRPIETGKDGMGEPTKEWVPETVENVLWGPTKSVRLDDKSSGVISGARPLGVDVTITAYFPKTFTGSLAGCRLEAYGKQWDVQGEPEPHLDDLVPGNWNRTVVARRVDG